jgi:hypothetical protein
MPVGGLPPDLRPMRGVPSPLGAAPLHHVRRALSARGKRAVLAGWGGSIGGRNCLHSRICFPPAQQLPCSAISSSSQLREAPLYAQKASLTRPGPGHKVEQTSRFWRVLPPGRGLRGHVPCRVAAPLFHHLESSAARPLSVICQLSSLFGEESGTRRIQPKASICCTPCRRTR